MNKNEITRVLKNLINAKKSIIKGEIKRGNQERATAEQTHELTALYEALNHIEAEIEAERLKALKLSTYNIKSLNCLGYKTTYNDIKQNYISDIISDLIGKGTIKSITIEQTEKEY